MKNKYKFLHTMIRVIDLDKSIAFYCDYFQMKLIRRKVYPGGEFTLAFLGYGEEHNSTVIELTYNWGRKDNYDLGNGFGHLAIGVPDIYKTCKKLADAGLDIPRPPGPMAHGGSIIAFIKDPDGYLIELIERK
jgi:lactoylglutathione lyase